MSLCAVYSRRKYKKRKPSHPLVQLQHPPIGLIAKRNQRQLSPLIEMKAVGVAGHPFYFEFTATAAASSHLSHLLGHTPGIKPRLPRRPVFAFNQQQSAATSPVTPPIRLTIPRSPLPRLSGSASTACSQQDLRSAYSKGAPLPLKHPSEWWRTARTDECLDPGLQCEEVQQLSLVVGVIPAERNALPLRGSRPVTSGRR